jgi:hypothetical protein
MFVFSLKNPLTISAAVQLAAYNFSPIINKCVETKTNFYPFEPKLSRGAAQGVF